MDIQCGKNIYSFESIVDKYSNMLMRLAMIRMGNKEDAEEVVQDTFLKLIYEINKGNVFNDEEHLKAWLLTVATNRGKSILNLMWNRRTQGLDTLEETTYEDKHDEGYAYEYVMKLPEKYRVAIDLFYYEQLKTDEIAKIMKTKESTVRSYLHRGRERLKEMMEVDA